MRLSLVGLGLALAIPSALLSYYFYTTRWTEVIGYTTYNHQFNPALWILFAFLSVVGFSVMVLGIGLDSGGHTRKGLGFSSCPVCGAPRTSRFCQNCGARME